MEKSIIIGGDLFPTPVNQYLFEKGDCESLFGEQICSLFNSSQYSICNLEGVLTDSTGQVEKSSGPKIKASGASITAYKLLGIKCLATANNHVMDYLKQGYEDTCKILDNSNIDHLGSGVNESLIKKYITISIANKSICIYNVAETMYNVADKNTPGVNIYDEYTVCKDICELKPNHDYIIVIYHGGTEFYEYPTPMLKKRFHRMADCGANMITAQHTHCLGCEEYYNGSYLLYGQGNFLFTRHKGHCGGGVLLEIKIGENIEIVKHHYTHNEYGVRISQENSYLTDFYARSSRIGDDNFLVEQFKSFAFTLYPKLSSSFQHYNFLDKLIKFLMPKLVYKSYRSRFRIIYPNRDQLLRIIYILESEQQCEAALYAMQYLLEKRL